jgi:hypothetical protein
VDYGRSEPAPSPEHPHFNVQAPLADWTSSPLKSNSGVLYLNLFSGGVTEGDGFDFGFAVWPVRDEQRPLILINSPS